MTATSAAPVADDAAAPIAEAPGRLTLTARPIRAAPRVYLSASHLEQLFGPGQALTPLSEGLLGEALFLERVSVTGAQRREVRARVCASPAATTRVVLPTAALLALDVRGAPALGQGEGVGTAISGPRGAVVLSSGVYRTSTRLVLPVALARKLHVPEVNRFDAYIPGSADPLETGLAVEVLAAAEEPWVILDNPAWERLQDPGSPLLLRLYPSSAEANGGHG